MKIRTLYECQAPAVKESMAPMAMMKSIFIHRIQFGSATIQSILGTLFSRMLAWPKYREGHTLHSLFLYSKSRFLHIVYSYSDRSGSESFPFS